MKKKNIFSKRIALFFICLAIPALTYAQNDKKIYANIDWQLNLPIGNSFANKLSGWGAHGELGYFFTPNISLGAFVSYHTNNKYIDRQTFMISETSTITSDQQHSIFQIPFGAIIRYSFANESICVPYIGLQIGTRYSEVSSQMNIFKTYERKWGFLISPEIGMNLYTSRSKNLGFNMSIYYDYSTNKSKVLGYSVDGLNNVGMRVGVAF